MNLRSRRKFCVNESVASTSTATTIERLSPSPNSNPPVEKEYIFPSHLTKDNGWKEEAISRKYVGNAAELCDVIIISDFCNKFFEAFNLTPFSESDLEKSLICESPLSTSIVVGLITDLIKGFTSIDGTNNIRMFQRNRIYRETNYTNFNSSLWEFLEHDWKFLGGNRIGIANILGPLKEKANFFELPLFIRAHLLADLCHYRLACYDAENIIDSVVDETHIPMGEQLRTLPFGRFKGENYYYFGGTRVYRSKNLSKKDSKKHQKIFDEKFPLKHMSYKCESSVIENGIEKEMIMEVDEVKNELNEKNESGVEINMNRLLNQDSDEEDHNMESTSSCGIAKSEVSHNLGKESNLFEDCIFAFHDSLQRQYFRGIFCSNEVWEVVCRDEDDIHYLIEYFRHCGSKAQSSMVHALIGTVLPSVQKSSERRVNYFIKSAEKSTVFTQEGAISRYDSRPVVRCSMRLQEKKIRQEELSEERKRLEIEQENIIREAEGRKPIEINHIHDQTSKMTREERLRNRQQRIEESNFATAKKKDEFTSNNHELQVGSNEIAKIRDTSANYNFNTVMQNDKNNKLQTKRKLNHHGDTISSRNYKLSNMNYFGANKFHLKQSSGRKNSFLQLNGSTNQECHNTTFGVSTVGGSAISIANTAPRNIIFNPHQRHNASISNSFLKQAFVPKSNPDFKQLSNSHFSSSWPHNPCSSVHQSNIVSESYMAINNESYSTSLSENDCSLHLNSLAQSYPRVSEQRCFASSTISYSDEISQNQDAWVKSNSPSCWEQSRQKDLQFNAVNTVPHCTTDAGNVYFSDSDSFNEKLDVDKVIDPSYLEYFYDSQDFLNMFRIQVPEGTRLILNATGPLRDHDYAAATVQLILDQNWSFVTEPLVEDPNFRRVEFHIKLSDDSNLDSEQQIMDSSVDTIDLKFKSDYFKNITEGQQLQQNQEINQWSSSSKLDHYSSVPLGLNGSRTFPLSSITDEEDFVNIL